MNNETKTQEQKILDLIKAKIHFGQQLSIILEKGLSYHDFWKFGFVNKRIVNDSYHYLSFLKSYYFDENGNVIKNDIPDEEGAYYPSYHWLYVRRSTDEIALLQNFGIDCSKGFETWHIIYFDLVKNEYERYLSSLSTYSFDYQSILKKDTPSLMQSDIQNIEIESIKKARIHFSKQLKTFLDIGCTYHDFWNSNLGEDIGLCFSKMWDLYSTNDYSNEKVKAMFILYGIDERSEDEKKSMTSKVEIPAFQRIGIDCSNGFQEWHKKYCELAEREWNQYSSNLENYSFDFSILEKVTPSVSKPKKAFRATTKGKAIYLKVLQEFGLLPQGMTNEKLFKEFGKRLDASPDKLGKYFQNWNNTDNLNPKDTVDIDALINFVIELIQKENHEKEKEMIEYTRTLRFEIF